MTKKDLNSQLIERIDTVIEEYEQSLNASDFGIEFAKYYYFLSRFESLINSLPRNENNYRSNLDQAKGITHNNSSTPNAKLVNNKIRLAAIVNILKALREDVSSGYVSSISEIIHADLFADFTEMAEHLLEEGYKDPAAVIIGSVLEEHLRKLCIKNSLPIESADAKGVIRPKKADTLNSELAAANVYGKLDQKSVTAWLDLRNKAAHGHYGDYLKAQVDLLLQSVRDFITRHPA